MNLPKRKSPRIRGYDYSCSNVYFVTSCVQGWSHEFGEVRNGKMVLNESGKIAREQWEWLFKQYPYIRLHGFVIMPNHMHALIEIIQAPATKILPLYRIIGAYKTTTSKKIHLAGNTKFEWQRSFHDSIARDAYAIERIKNYIEKNPERWEKSSGESNKS